MKMMKSAAWAKIEEAKVVTELVSSILSNDDSTDESPPEMVPWEEFNQQMKDYKKLATIFEELVVVGEVWRKRMKSTNWHSKNSSLL